MKTLFKIEKDGNVLLQDQTIALSPALYINIKTTEVELSGGL